MSGVAPIRFPPFREIGTRRGVESVRHKALVNALCERDDRVAKKGFAKSLMGAISAGFEPDTPPNDILHGYNKRRVPDAFLIDHDEFAVIIWEAVVTHEISKEKLRDYTELWFVLDAHGWHLGLVRIDQCGAEVGVCLMEAWYDRHYGPNLVAVD